MFNGPRYLTRGIEGKMGFDLQLALLIDNLRFKGAQLDYLQVFDLEVIEAEEGTAVQKVIHRIGAAGLLE